MLNNFVACLTLIAGLLFAVALEYGFDKEETRQVYLQYVENQDFEKTITGCKFKSNCDYYNNLLWTAVEQGGLTLRSLDFTVCTTKCTVPCWRKLTKEEEEWLKNNPNRMSYADFDCANKTVEEYEK